MLLSVGLSFFYDDDLFARISDAVATASTIVPKSVRSKSVAPPWLWPKPVMFPGKYGIRAKQKALS
jgi:hypothetical protein